MMALTERKMDRSYKNVILEKEILRHNIDVDGFCKPEFELIDDTKRYIRC